MYMVVAPLVSACANDTVFKVAALTAAQVWMYPVLVALTDGVIAGVRYVIAPAGPADVPA
jgi:hypothetical protein